MIVQLGHFIRFIQFLCLDIFCYCSIVCFVSFLFVLYNFIRFAKRKKCVCMYCFYFFMLALCHFVAVAIIPIWFSRICFFSFLIKHFIRLMLSHNLDLECSVCCCLVWLSVELYARVGNQTFVESSKRTRFNGRQTKSIPPFDCSEHRMYIVWDRYDDCDVTDGEKKKTRKQRKKERMK